MDVTKEQIARLKQTISQCRAAATNAEHVLTYLKHYYEEQEGR